MSASVPSPGGRALAAAVPRKSVFISYSRADLVRVRALALALRECGIRTWLDLDDLLPGQRWKEAIADALAAADAMVFCMSALSLESAWTSVELGKAMALALPVIPVAMEPFDAAALPAQLRDLHVHDMSLHPPRHAAAATANGIALALGVAGGAAVQLCAGGAEPSDVVALLVVAMDAASAAAQQACAALAGAGGGAVAELDFGAVGAVRVADLVHWAGQARRAVLVVGASTDYALAGLVLGTLVQAFGSDRSLLLTCGAATAEAEALARAAAVPLQVA